MRKKRKKWHIALAAACLILSAVCFIAGSFLRNRGNDFLKNLTIEAEGEGFESQWLKSCFVKEASQTDSEEEAEEGISFAAWTELGNEAVFEGSGVRGGNTDVIAVFGSSYCLLPFGKNLAAEDSSGCIIGKGLAEKLFGSSHAQGQELLWNNQKWTVRSVVSEPSDFVMVEASGLADEIHFDRINIVPGKNGDRQLTGENFISRHGLLAHVLCFDYLDGISWLSGMVPGEWSDFDGWKQNFRKYQKAAALVQNAEKSVLEAAGMGNRKKGSRLFLCSVVLWMAGGWLLFKVRNCQQLN